MAPLGQGAAGRTRKRPKRRGPALNDAPYPTNAEKGAPQLGHFPGDGAGARSRMRGDTLYFAHESLDSLPR